MGYPDRTGQMGKTIFLWGNPKSGRLCMLERSRSTKWEQYVEVNPIPSVNYITAAAAW